MLKHVPKQWSNVPVCTLMKKDRQTLPVPTCQPDSICTFTCFPSLLCLITRVVVLHCQIRLFTGGPMSRHDVSNICSSFGSGSVLPCFWLHPVCNSFTSLRSPPLTEAICLSATYLCDTPTCQEPKPPHAEIKNKNTAETHKSFPGKNLGN